MSNPTANFGWVMPTATDLVTDLPADFAVFGQAVDTSMAGLLGGTTGQILSKTSGTNMAFTWVTPNPGDITGVTAGTGISGGGTSGDVTITNSMATAITTAGDLIQGTGSGTFARLGTGTAGQYLTTNGTTNSWGTISSGGMTLISTTTLSGASVTLSSIPQTYKTLVLYIRNYQPVTDGAILQMRFNGVTTASYAGNDLGVSSSQTFSATKVNVTLENDNTVAQGLSAVTLYDYTNATTWKWGNMFTIGNDSTTTTTARIGSYYIAHNNTAAITSITLLASSGSLTSGTVLLYGVS